MQTCYHCYEENVGPIRQHSKLTFDRAPRTGPLSRVSLAFIQNGHNAIF